MKIGDAVIVQFKDGFEPEHGVLVDHTEDWGNVTIKTDRGGLMNGPVAPGDIKKASLFE